MLWAKGVACRRRITSYNVCYTKLLRGIRAFGVHLNGYLRRADGLHLWVSRRARDKKVAPGKLDNMVAGGQPAGLSLKDNLIKECGEEASLAPELAARALPVGLVRYCFSTETGLKPDTLFCYDLEMPETVIPTPNDDESEGFELWHVNDVLDALASSWEFKFNVITSYSIHYTKLYDHLFARLLRHKQTEQAISEPTHFRN